MIAGLSFDDLDIRAARVAKRYGAEWRSVRDSWQYSEAWVGMLRAAPAAASHPNPAAYLYLRAMAEVGKVLDASLAKKRGGRGRTGEVVAAKTVPMSAMKWQTVENAICVYPDPCPLEVAEALAEASATPARPSPARAEVRESVLGLRRRGVTIGDIARRLGIPHTTAQRHVEALRREGRLTEDRRRKSRGA